MPYPELSGTLFRNYTEDFPVSKRRSVVTEKPSTGSRSGAGEPRRRLRADAQRNIDALLEAAKAVFGTSGVDAPAKEIADLAGVGVGTLYRHFPQRSDLVVAVFQREIDACADAAPGAGRRARAGSSAREVAPPVHRVPRDQARTRRGPALGRSGVRRPARLLLAAARACPRVAARRRGGERRDPRRHQRARTCCTPSPTCACPCRTEGPPTASAWSRSSSTDCATAPARRGAMLPTRKRKER